MDEEEGGGERQGKIDYGIQERGKEGEREIKRGKQHIDKER